VKLVLMLCGMRNLNSSIGGCAYGTPKKKSSLYVDECIPATVPFLIATVGTLEDVGAEDAMPKRAQVTKKLIIVNRRRAGKRDEIYSSIQTSNGNSRILVFMLFGLVMNFHQPHCHRRKSTSVAMAERSRNETGS